MNDAGMVDPGDGGATAIPRSRILARKGPSLGMRLARFVVGRAPKALADPEAFRSAVQARTPPRAAPVPAAFASRFRISEREIEGHSVVTLAPRGGASRWRIVYTHGGAYVNELVKPHWDIIAGLIQATGAEVTVLLYPLAPESDHRAVWGFLLSVYRDLLSRTAPGNIVLAGDSAGGGLALGQVLAFADAGLPAPARLLLFSPWLDLTLSDPEAGAYEAADPMLGVEALRLCGAWWAGGDDPREPRLSPLYADPSGWPPIDLYQGDNDLLVVDSRSFAARASRAGADVTYVEYPGSFHVFVAATFSAEAKDVFRRISGRLPRR